MDIVSVYNMNLVDVSGDDSWLTLLFFFLHFVLYFPVALLVRCSAHPLTFGRVRHYTIQSFFSVNQLKYWDGDMWLRKHQKNRKPRNTCMLPSCLLDAITAASGIRWQWCCRPPSSPRCQLSTLQKQGISDHLFYHSSQSGKVIFNTTYSQHKCFTILCFPMLFLFTLFYVSTWESSQRSWKFF
jgi:hypothetical protein